MQRVRLWAGASIAMLSMLAIAACSNGGDDSGASVPIRPIEEIVVGEIAITQLQPTSAAVEVETSIDVVCSVVFGVDTSYGRISTDPDMGGAAHRDHFAPLRGLEPDTVYHFRLQGSGPDGTLYVSEDLTFRTPPTESGSQPVTANLARLDAGARVVEVSSVFGGAPAWAGEHALDGDPDTEWSSADDGDDAFITIELAEPARIGAVGLWTRTMRTSAEISRFQVITEDGTVLGPFDVPDSTRMHRFEVDVHAHVLRFEVLESTGGNTGAVELGVFAAE
jgi:hypothetical protein